MMRITPFCLILSFIVSSPAIWAKKKDDSIEICPSSREFITTMSYLRKHEDFDLAENQIRRTADDVSKGCKNAAERFIVVSRILLRAGLGGKSSLQKGLEFSKASDSEFKMFIHIFKRTYLRGQLDLTLKRAIEVATEISQKLDGNNKNVKKTFDRIVSACHGDTMPLPPQRCSETAVKVAKAAKKFKTNLGKSFNQLFTYMTSGDGANLPTYKALDLAEKLILYGPKADNNFYQAYKYATSQTGLDLGRIDSVKFAVRLAKRSYKREKKEDSQEVEKPVD